MRCRALVFTVVALLWSSSVSAQTTIAFLDPSPTPPTLEGMAARAEVIVHGRVARPLGPRLEGNVVLSGALISVQEALKSSGLPAGVKQIQVDQAGGTVTVQGKQHSTSFVGEVLDQGDEVLLFLLPSNRGSTFMPAFRNAVLRFRAGETEGLAPRVKASSFGNRSTVPSADLLYALRQTLTAR